MEKLYALLMAMLINIPINDMQLYFFSTDILMDYESYNWIVFIFFNVNFIKIISHEPGLEVYICNASIRYVKAGGS